LNQIIAWGIALFAYLLTRYAEFRVHRENCEFLEFANADERMPRLMCWFYALGWLVIPCAALEAFERATIPTTWHLTTALSCLVIGLVLRVVTLNALGRLWTMRCFYIPGVPQVKRGIYRWIRHPEYVARLLDGLGLSLLLAAHYTAALFSLTFFILVRRIAAFEREQIDEMKGSEGLEDQFQPL